MHNRDRRSCFSNSSGSIELFNTRSTLCLWPCTQHLKSGLQQMKNKNRLIVSITHHFSDRIQWWSSFVVHQYGRVFQDSPSNSYPLFFTARQLQTSFPNLSLVSFGHALDCIMNLRHLRCLVNFFGCRVNTAVIDVVKHIIVKEYGVLRGKGLKSRSSRKPVQKQVHKPSVDSAKS